VVADPLEKDDLGRKDKALFRDEDAPRALPSRRRLPIPRSSGQEEEQEVREAGGEESGAD
jgi:hypothetical protein